MPHDKMSFFVCVCVGVCVLVCVFVCACVSVCCACGVCVCVCVFACVCVCVLCVLVRTCVYSACQSHVGFLLRTWWRDWSLPAREGLSPELVLLS